MDIVGLDLLGSAQYAKEAVDIMSRLQGDFPGQKFAIGIIVEASGWSSGMVAARKLIKCSNVVAIRLHGIWRDDHNFQESDIKRAVEIAKRAKKLAINNPTKKVYYSPFLEHAMKDDLLVKVHTAVSKVLDDGVTYVNAAMPNGAKLKSSMKGFEEIHHETGKPDRTYIFSFDGHDQNDTDVEMYKNKHKDSNFFFSWVFPYNLKYTEKDKTQRADRKLVPPYKLVYSIVVQMLTKKGVNTKLPGDRIFKAFGEPGYEKDHSKPIERSWQMVFISPYNGKTITFKDRKNKVVATFTKTTGKYDGRNIFRCPEWGIDVLKKIDVPTKVVTVYEGETAIGKVNPLFRQNNYEN